jgi:hypothetical protein
MEKSNGTYELIVWGDQAPPKSTNVVVNLGSSYPTVNVYDITSGTTPVQTLPNASSVPLTLGDHADAALASDDGPIFSTVAKLVEANAPFPRERKTPSAKKKLCALGETRSAGRSTKRRQDASAQADSAIPLSS